MSVSLDKATSEPGTTTPDHVFITVAQLPDGRVSSIVLSDYAPDPAEQWMDEPRATVWTMPARAWDTDPTHASKVLDLAISHAYATTDGQSWADGERIATAFHYDHTTAREFLRTVEAHLIHAGFTTAYTGMVACQHYGLTLDAGHECYVYKTPDGWRFAIEDCMEHDGRAENPSVIAPLDASPRRVATAILLQLADHALIEPAMLSTLAGLRLRFGLLRATPHWANFKYRAGQRLDRYRRRVTARVPR